MRTPGLTSLLSRPGQEYPALIPFDRDRHRMVQMDMSSEAGCFPADVFQDNVSFCEAVDGFLQSRDAHFAYGGYGELRDVYACSGVFDGQDLGEPRRFHLGLDIWGPAGTSVYAPIEGVVHSQGFLPAAGDYGAVIIVRHEWEGVTFHTLYGHLSLSDLVFREGDPVSAGMCIGHFGKPSENGQWPPHLHLQVVVNMDGMHGDYPGVCRYSERDRYLSNCPDPTPLLRPRILPTQA